MASMTTRTTESKTEKTGSVQDIFSGFATSLFSIPEGMIYTRLAGVKVSVLEAERMAWDAARKWLEEGVK